MLLFHWWANHQALARYLVRDSRWALVYYDETTLVAVRRAGNEDVVARAQAAFPAARAETERLLLEPGPSWQVPVAQERALAVYAALLEGLGQRNAAAPFRKRLSELGS